MSTQTNGGNPFLINGKGKIERLTVDDLTEFVVKVRERSMNLLTGVGTSNDPMSHELAVLDDKYYSRENLEALFGLCHELKTTVQSEPEDMVESWFVWTPTKPDNDLQKRVNEKLAKVLKPIYYETQYKANFTGGGITGRLANDGAPLEAPLRSDLITPDNPIRYSIALDKYHVQPQNYYPDNRNPQYYLMNYAYPSSSGYEVNAATGKMEPKEEPLIYGALVHSSRLLRCNGKRTGVSRFGINGGWDDSVLLDPGACYQDYEATLKSVRAAIRTFEILINYIKNFPMLIDQDEAEEQMINLAQADAFAQSVLGMQFADKDNQKYEILDREFKGIPELLEVFKKRADTATQVSSWKLRKELPESFLGSTGIQMRVRELNDVIRMTKRRWHQELLIDVDLVLRSNGIFMSPDDWSLNFNKGVWLSPDEEVRIYLDYAKGDRINVQGNVLTAREARSRHGGERVGELVLDEEAYNREQEAKATEVEEQRTDAQQRPVIKTKHLVIDVVNLPGSTVDGTKIDVSQGISRSHFDSNGNPLKVIVGNSLDSTGMYLVEVANPLTDDFQEERIIIKVDGIEDAERVYSKNFRTPHNGIRTINSATLAKMENPQHSSIKASGKGLSLEELEAV